MFLNVGDIGLATAYIHNDRICKFVGHLLSFAYVPMDSYDNADPVVQRKNKDILAEVSMRMTKITHSFNPIKIQS